MSYSADAITARNDANKVRISVRLKVKRADMCLHQTLKFRNFLFLTAC